LALTGRAAVLSYKELFMVIRLVAILMISLLAVGCGGGAGETGPSENAPTEQGDPLAEFIQKEMPVESVDLIFAIDEESFGEEITVVGKVSDIAPGFAAFRLVDLSLQDCMRDEDPCLLPWDY
jgi:hypothetical protein